MPGLIVKRLVGGLRFLIRSGVLIGLGLGSAQANPDGSAASPGTEAGAQQSEALLEVLNAVPVYYLVHEGNRPVTLPTPDGTRVAPVFFYPQAAMSMRDEILAGPAAPAEKIEGVAEAGLGDMYQLQSSEGAVRFLLIGDPRQVANARRILGVDSFNAVPVFAAKQASTGRYVAMKGDAGKMVVAVFIEAERLERAIGDVMRAEASLEGDVVVDVMALDALVNGLHGGQLSTDEVQMIPPPSGRP